MGIYTVGVRSEAPGNTSRIRNPGDEEVMRMSLLAYELGSKVRHTGVSELVAALGG